MAMTPLALRNWVEAGADLSECSGDCEAIRIKKVLDFIEEVHDAVASLPHLTHDDLFSGSDEWRKANRVLRYITSGKLPDGPTDCYVSRLKMYPHDPIKALPLYAALRMSPVAAKDGTTTCGDLTVKYKAGGPVFGMV